MVSQGTTPTPTTNIAQAPAAPPAGYDTVVVAMPPPGQSVTIPVVPATAYQMTAPDVTFTQQGANLVAVGPEGGQVVFEDYFTFASSDLPPALTLADGAVIPQEQIFAELGNPDLNAAEPAAGPGAGAGGVAAAGGGAAFTPYDPGDIGTGLSVLDLLGNLDPASEVPDPPQEPGVIDFAEGTVSIEVITETVVPDVPGGIPSGVYSGAFEDGRPNAHVGDNTYTAPVLNVIFTPADDETVDQTTLTGFPIGVQLTLTDGTIIDITSLDQEVIVPGGLETGIRITQLPENSDADFVVTAAVEISDTTTGVQTATIIASGTVVVDAVADQAIFETGNVSANEDNATGPGADGNYADGQPRFGIGFSAQVADQDGSEELTAVSLVLSGFMAATLAEGVALVWNGTALADGDTIEIPAEIFNSSGTPDAGSVFMSVGIVTNEAGEIVVTLTSASGGGDDAQILSIDLAGLQVQLPQHSDDDFSVAATVTSSETNLSDTELTDLNNTAQHTQTFDVEVLAVADAATGVGLAEISDVVAKEDGSVTPTFSATFSDNDGSESHYLTVNIPEGWSVSVTDAEAGWEPVLEGGVIVGYTIDVTAQGANVSASGLSFSPPADSDIDASLTVVATTVEHGSDGAVAVANAVSSAEVTLVVDAVADTTEVEAAVAYDEGRTAVAEGAPVTIAVTATFGDYTDGSESHFVLVELQDGWTNSEGYDTETVDGVLYVRIPVDDSAIGGDGTITIDVTLTAPTTVEDSTTFTLGVLAKAVETSTGDDEPDTSDNVYISSASVSVVVDPSDVGEDAVTGSGEAYEDGDSAAGTYTLINGVLHGYPISLALADNATGTEHDSSETIESYTVTGMTGAPGTLYYTTDGSTYTAVAIGGTSIPGDAQLYFVPSQSNSDVDVTLTISATVVDGDSGSSTTVPGTATVIVDAVADAPQIHLNPETTSSTIRYAGEASGYANAIGVYTLDTDGNPTAPQILVVEGDGTNVGDVVMTLDGGVAGLHFFIVSDGAATLNGVDDTRLGFTETVDGKWVLTIDGNPIAQNVYFDQADLNPNDLSHTAVVLNPDGTYTVGFEDLPGLGDRDFNDIAVNVEQKINYLEDGNANIPIDDRLAIGIGFTANATDTDGSEELTSVSVTLSGIDNPAGTEMMWNGAPISDGDTISVPATVFGSADPAMIEMTVAVTTDGSGNIVYTLTSTVAAGDDLQVLSLDLNGLQVALPSDSDDDFDVTVAVTSTETNPTDGELTGANNSTTTTTTFSVVVDAVADTPTDVSASTGGISVTATGFSTVSSTVAAWAAEGVHVSAIIADIAPGGVTETASSTLTLKSAQPGDAAHSQYTYPAGLGVNSGSGQTNTTEIDSRGTGPSGEALKISFDDQSTSVTLHLSVLFGGAGSQYETVPEIATAYAYDANGNLLDVVSVGGEEDGTADLTLVSSTGATIATIFLVSGNDNVSDFTLAGITTAAITTVVETNPVTITASASFDDVVDGSEEHFILVEVPSNFISEGAVVTDGAGNPITDFEVVHLTAADGVVEGDYIKIRVDDQLSVDGDSATVKVTLISANVDGVSDTQTAHTYGMAVETADAADVATGTELTTANNIAISNAATVVITVLDTLPTISGPLALDLQEADLGSSGTDVASGEITVTAAEDAVTVALSPTGITIEGLEGDLLWTLSGDGKTLTGHEDMNGDGIADGVDPAITISLVGDTTLDAGQTVTYTVTATLSDALQNVLGGEPVVINGIGVVATDSDPSHPDIVSTTVSLTIADDVPSATDAVAGVAETTVAAPANVVLMLDLSGSMGGDQVDLMKGAVQNLLNTYGVSLGNVMITTFANSASTTGWMSGAQALAWLSTLSNPSGNTDFDDALASLQSNYSTPGNGLDTVVYFLSDGKPSGSDGLSINDINSSEKAAWQNFLSSHGEIANVYAVGVGAAATLNFSDWHLGSGWTEGLQAIAWSRDGDNGDNLFKIIDNDDLAGRVDTSSGIANAPVVGTLGFDGGADGAEITELAYTMDGHTVTSTVNGDGDLVLSIAYVNPVTGDTVIYGALVVDPATGAYTFTPVPGVDTNNVSFDIAYTVTDADGDTATAHLGLSFGDLSEVSATDDSNSVGVGASKGTEVISSNEIIAAENSNLDSLQINKPGLSGETKSTNTSFDIAGTQTATVTASVDVTNYTFIDTVRVYLEVKNPNGTWSTVNGSTKSISSDEDVSWTISGKGEYRVAVSATDGNLFNNNLKVHVQNIKVSESSGVITTNTTVRDVNWASAASVAAVLGNVMANDAQGSEGAVVASVDGTEVSAGGTVVHGSYGDLTIDVDGSYSYKLTQDFDDNSFRGTDADVVDSFVYTIAQGDGDFAIATLDIDVTQGLPSGATSVVSGGYAGANGHSDAQYSAAQNFIFGTVNGDVLRGGGGDDYINGGDGDDTLYGDAGNDHLVGAGGNDTLIGGDGNDLLEGGSGDDLLIGGSGADTFKFNAITDGKDTIGDFSVGQGDTIDLDTLFDNLGVAEADRGIDVVQSGSDPNEFTVTLTVGGAAAHPEFSITVHADTTDADQIKAQVDTQG